MFTNYIEVDIDKIKNNIEKIKQLSKQTNICAVVKANAYGLGAVVIAKYIEDQVSYFAVATFIEAKNLRLRGIKKPIIILGYVSLEEAKECADLNIEIPIYDLAYAKKINDSLDFPVKAHIAIDTGHSRLGFREFEFDKILELKKLNKLEIKGVFSHFSTADEEDKTFTNEQYEKFDRLREKLNDEFEIEIFHIANSAASIYHKTNCDMDRIGIAMYGIYPSDYLRNREEVKLEQVFSLRSRISFVKEINKGDSVSYGRTFIAKDRMKIATIPIGYSDGYFRSFSNIGEVLVKDKIAKVCGRVCMDQIMVDVSDIECEIEDEVIVYPDIYKEANKIGTIPYELMTSFDMRLTRVYIKDGSIVHIDNYLGELYEN